MAGLVELSKAAKDDGRMTGREKAAMGVMLGSGAGTVALAPGVGWNLGEAAVHHQSARGYDRARRRADFHLNNYPHSTLGDAVHAARRVNDMERGAKNARRARKASLKRAGKWAAPMAAGYGAMVGSGMYLRSRQSEVGKRDSGKYYAGKDERKVTRRAVMRDPGFWAAEGTSLGMLGGAVHQIARNPKRSIGLSVGSLVPSSVALARGQQVQNRARREAGYPARTAWSGRQKTSKSLSEVAKSAWE